MKHTTVTKIDVKNNDEDLCSTRQITITNCNKYVFEKTYFRLKKKCKLLLLFRINVENLNVYFNRQISYFCQISFNTYFKVIFLLSYRLSCTMLSSDHKYVAAGSMDSIIYVWERSNLSYVMDVQNNIENNTHTISQNENLVEL